jgi:D-3-phosphoglycerate dehydrogenase
MKILITAELTEPILDRLRAGGHQLRVDTTWAKQRHILSEEAMIQLAADGCEIIIAEMEPVSEQVMDAAGNLRLVASARANPVNVDMAAAAARGITVLHAPGRNSRSVAELTIGLMITLARQVVRADAFIRDGQWRAEHRWWPHLAFQGPILGGHTLGLVGYGAVGRQVARRVQAFDMEILIYDPYVKSVEPFVQSVSLQTLLRQSDFVSLHALVTEETTGMIGAEELALMKPTAYLINTARAALVNEEALYQTLVTECIAGAALDVFWREPLPSDSRWLTMTNVILTPHLGGASPDTTQSHSIMMLEDIERFLKGQRPIRLANPEVWERQHPEGTATA